MAQPDSPLAHYDLAVAKLSAGNDDGLRDLALADRLSCNVFLHYQTILWRVARDLEVPVVDIALHFQAYRGGELFLDPAHPSATGHQIIADALWPAIQALAERRD
jgi:lysophospholipase L1-like esterase